MHCAICNRKAKNLEPFGRLEWKFKDVFEFEERKKDGRTTWIHDVCADCIYEYSGVDRRDQSVGDLLHGLNKSRPEGNNNDKS